MKLSELTAKKAQSLMLGVYDDEKIADRAKDNLTFLTLHGFVTATEIKKIQKRIDKIRS
jgi:hypothetical protein